MYEPNGGRRTDDKGKRPLTHAGQGCPYLLRKGGEIMDMTAVSAAMSVRQAVTQQAIGTAVTKLAMNQQQQSGQMVVDLLKSASPAGKASLPHLGQNIDISI